MNSKASMNPIADGTDGLRTLREFGDCDVPRESKALNEKVQEVIQLDGVHPVAENALGKAIFAGLKMAKHCEKNTHVRTAVKFASDETLNQLTENIKAAEAKGIALQEEIQALIQDAQGLLEERWHYSVKNFGLDPDHKFYRVNEEKGVIEEVELRCDQCTAGKEMIEARESVEEYFKSLNENVTELKPQTTS